MDFLLQLQQAVQAVKDQINGVLKGLPPLEQFEASADMSYGIRSLQRGCSDLAETATNLSTKAAEIMAQATTAAKAEGVTAAKAELLANKEFISKEDHTSAVTAAVGAKEIEVRNAITAEISGKETIATRRNELITDKVLPAIVAHKVPAVVLEGEGYKDNAGKIKARFDLLATDTGISAEAAELTDDQRTVIEGIAGLGLEAADDTTFATRLSLMKTAVTAAKATPKGNGEVNPLQGAGGSGSAEVKPSAAGNYRPGLL